MNRYFWFVTKSELARGPSRTPRRIGQQTIFTRHFVVSVGEQFEVQAFFRAELLMRIGTVHADSEYDRVVFFVLFLIPLKVMRLNGAAVGEILRIEIKHHPAAAVVFEVDGLAFLRSEGKVRRHTADGWYRSGTRHQRENYRGEAKS